MATPHPDAPRAPRERHGRQPRLPMSLSQLQAYLVARETLRRVKGSPRPCFARDPSTPPDGGGTSPPPR